jgi:hypothetical protein
MSECGGFVSDLFQRCRIAYRHRRRLSLFLPRIFTDKRGLRLARKALFIEATAAADFGLARRKQDDENHTDKEFHATAQRTTQSPQRRTSSFL